MAESQYSLSWHDHSQNICQGLSYLQQNGEFVDMTLAADGHLVKVHQVIMALSSPYLKDLIASAACPHPVIVLNKISYSTLSAILEYIYTGEVMIAIDNVRELVDAAKELHIKGLQEMDLSVTRQPNESKAESHPDTNSAFAGKKNIPYYKLQIQETEDQIDSMAMNEEEVSLQRDSDCDSLHELRVDDKTVASPDALSMVAARKPTTLTASNSEKNSSLLYTVSNQGSLQLIVNRYVYYLKNSRQDKTRRWICVDYLNKCKCPASVVTRDNVVVRRMLAHKHPFHDKRILKKMKSNTVFSELTDAEQRGRSLTTERNRQRGRDSE